MLPILCRASFSNCCWDILTIAERGMNFIRKWVNRPCGSWYPNALNHNCHSSFHCVMSLSLIGIQIHFFISSSYSTSAIWTFTRELKSIFPIKWAILHEVCQIPVSPRVVIFGSGVSARLIFGTHATIDARWDAEQCCDGVYLRNSVQYVSPCDNGLIPCFVA